MILDLQSSGLLHSEICGSKLACNSPQLIAAYHVLLRLLMPRHSPCALISLTTLLGSSFRIMLFIWEVIFEIVSTTFIVVEYFQCFPHLHYFLISLFNFQGTSLWRMFSFFMVGTSGLEPPTSRLSGVRSNHLSYAPISSGGDEEDRTPDPLRARQVLSQLSYTPVW